MTEHPAGSLYPRLLHSHSAELAEEFRGLSLSELESRADTEHPYTIFTPTGGSRVDERSLANIREGAREIAQDAGYPDPFPDAPSLDARYHFDFEIARFLHRKMAIPPGEAGKNDVWEFVACVLLPELVRWRFPGNQKSDFQTNTDRFLGGERNAFQRLWWRAELLGEDGDYQLLKELNEDELVQIMERPYMASQRELARATARRFVDVVSEHPDVDRMELMRNAQKRLRRLTPLVSFSNLNSEDLEREVSRVLSNAARAVSDIDLDDTSDIDPDESEEEAQQDKYESEEEASNILAREFDTELNSHQREIVGVLCDEFPERIEAGEIRKRVQSRLEAEISKSDVNRFLYRHRDDVFEKIGKRPPHWRLHPSLNPDELLDDTTEEREQDEESVETRGGAGDPGTVGKICRRIEADLEPLDRAVVQVLVDSFPQRLEAEEITTRVIPHLDDETGVSTFEVKRVLYRFRGNLLARTEGEPARWRIVRSVLPDRMAKGGSEGRDPKQKEPRNTDEERPEESGLPETVLREIVADLEPSGRAIVQVLINRFPERLNAREIAETVIDRPNYSGDIRTSDVSHFLYRHRGRICEKNDESPPRWRLDLPVAPDWSAGEEPGDSGHQSSSGGEGPASADADPTSRTVETRAEDSEPKETEKEGADSGPYRVTLVKQLGDVRAELADSDAGDGEGTTQVQILSRLVAIQTPYFQNGPRVMKPLTLQELANDLGVQPETVSRAVNDALLIFEGKEIPAEDLFSPGLPTSSGGKVAATAVRDMIAEFLTTEHDDREPLTDAEITNRLKNRGIEIAPSTVAKYRGQLGIDDDAGEQTPTSGIGVRTRAFPGDLSTDEENEGDQSKGHSDEAGGAAGFEDVGSGLQSDVLQVLSQSDIQMTALEISQHLDGLDRSEVKSLLEGPLGDHVAAEGVSPPRWTVKQKNEPVDAAEEDASLDLINRAVLDTLIRSPYRLSAKEIAKSINADTELEIDSTAVEAILRGPLKEKVTVHPGTTTRWSAQEA